ncbi:MAG: hypothetical protein ABI024_02640 [Vicinamibacterales bacterium]
MSKTATTINRLNDLLEITKLDTAIGPKYTGRRKKPARLRRAVAALSCPAAGRVGDSF